MEQYFSLRKRYDTNLTEQFLIQMGLTYVQMTLQTNTSLSVVQKAALQNFVNAGSQVSLAFQATPAGGAA